MEPQLREHDRVVVSRLAYRLHEPRRGDIVVFPSPLVPEEDQGFLEGLLDGLLETFALRQPDERDLIKRVVGLPGETVEAHDGSVHVDGRRLVEPYLPDDVATGDFGPEVVPEDHVFVMGDNRNNSLDSRSDSVGMVPRDRIIGRAEVRYWPLSDATLIDHHIGSPVQSVEVIASWIMRPPTLR